MPTVKKTKKAQYGESVYKDAKGYNVVTKTNTKDGPRYYKTTGPVESAARNRNLFNIKNNPADSVRAKDIDPIDLKKLAGMKNGGKAKDGKWMQKAAASIKKRGTAGKCTPITKPGCTGKAKALAKTFKAIAKKNKK